MRTCCVNNCVLLWCWVQHMPAKHRPLALYGSEDGLVWHKMLQVWAPLADFAEKLRVWRNTYVFSEKSAWHLFKLLYVGGKTLPPEWARWTARSFHVFMQTHHYSLQFRLQQFPQTIVWKLVLLWMPRKPCLFPEQEHISVWSKDNLRSRRKIYATATRG